VQWQSHNHVKRIAFRTLSLRQWPIDKTTAIGSVRTANENISVKIKTQTPKTLTFAISSQLFSFLVFIFELSLRQWLTDKTTAIGSVPSANEIGIRIKTTKP
jgi:hypothetical protein